MTWEEVIIKISQDDKYKSLIKQAYLNNNLTNNVENYMSSKEFEEILLILKSKCFVNNKIKIIDIGAGNGISSIAFALNGFSVTAIEPDTSSIVGTGAIQKLKERYSLNNISIVNSYGENIPLQNDSFHFAFCRQAMHHANDINKFIQEIYRLLINKGFLLTTRDHVIYNEKDKELFLNEHPLHKFYNGENAYTDKQYQYAFKNAGFEIVKILKHFDSVINYYPETKNDLDQKILNRQQLIANSLYNKIGKLSKFRLFKKMYTTYVDYKLGNVLDEKKKPGRLYSYLVQKR